MSWIVRVALAGMMAGAASFRTFRSIHSLAAGKRCQPRIVAAKFTSRQAG